MQPYVIRQGDYLAKLAHRFGFDADAVWNDPSNADLRELRPNPDILWPTDVLYIPEDSDNPPRQHELVLGTTNTFTSYVPTIPVSLRFTDEGLISQAYTILELPELTDLTTDGDGTAFFDVSVMQRAVTIVFMRDGTTFDCKIGDLDPVNTLSGICQRLQHLGYLPSEVDLDPPDLDQIRAALRWLRARHSLDTSGDDAGLDEDGHLDESTTQLLVDDHGS